MNKNSKLKHLIIISAVILAIAVALIGANTLFHKSITSIAQEDTITSIAQEDIGPYRQCFIDFEKICAEMTIEQRLSYIQAGEENLEFLNSYINSDSINPEKRFYARQSVYLTKRKLEIVKKYLPEEMR